MLLQNKTIKYLLYFKALVWLVLAVLYYVNQVSPNADVIFQVVAGLLLINAIIYFLLGLFWNMQNRLIVWAVVVFVVANVVLTVADNMGWVDWVSLATDVGILVVMFLALRNQKTTT